MIISVWCIQQWRNNRWLFNSWDQTWKHTHSPMENSIPTISCNGHCMNSAFVTGLPWWNALTIYKCIRVQQCRLDWQRAELALGNIGQSVDRVLYTYASNKSRLWSFAFPGYKRSNECNDFSMWGQGTWGRQASWDRIIHKVTLFMHATWRLPTDAW